jgi:serine protease Do
MRTMQIAILCVAALGASLLGAQPARDPRTAPVAPSSSFIGVGIQEIDAERAKALKLPEEAGVEITHVDPNSPAERAGLKAGDVVIQFNGQPVEGIAQFSRMARETPAGREVRLSIFRSGAPQTVTVKTGTRPAMPGYGPPMPPMDGFNLRLPDVPRSFMSWRNAVLGVEAESLDGQLAQYFGVTEGVLVRSVLKESAAEKAGIKAGDVITRVNDARVVTPADISSRVRSLRGKSIPVSLMRDRREITVTVTIGTEDHSGQLREEPAAPFWIRTISESPAL